MAEKKMRRKEIQRDNLVDSICRIGEFLNNYTDEQKNQVQIRLERLDELMENFETVQSEYETYDDTTEFVAANAKLRAELEEEFYRVKGGLTSKITPVLAAAVAQVPPYPVIQANHVKLPTISLPHFDGDLNSWLTFHDSFSSLIHSCVEIPCIQKFQYLRSALKGDALKLIESLTITSENYTIAWEALNKRYANKYLLKKKHLQALTAHTKLTAKTVSNLRFLLEDFERNVKILTQLGEPTIHWSAILVQLLSSQLDDGTLKDWEEHVSGENDPTYQNLVKFLTMKVRTLDSLSINAEQYQNSTFSKPNIAKLQKPTPSSRMNTYAITNDIQPDCLACNDKHPLVKCPVFDQMNLKDKLSLVNNKKVCSNCFRGNHFARKCTSKYSCRICQKRHHTTLHPGFEANNPNLSMQTSKPAPNSLRHDSEHGNVVTTPCFSQPVSLNSSVKSDSGSILLSTVVLIVMDANGCEYPTRALLDSGSQCNLMSERLCQQLRLNRSRVNHSVSGIGESQVRIIGSTSTTIKSRIGHFSTTLDCMVLRNLTSILPSVNTCGAELKLPKGIILADPEFNVSRKVDLIIGIEHFYTILKGGRFQLDDSPIMLVESEFGWLVSGKITTNSRSNTSLCCLSTLESIDHMLEKFWKIEEIDSKIPSFTEKQCENFYQETVYRDSTGRYIVKYPKKENLPEMIGESYSTAVRRLEYLERKLERNTDLKIEYHKFMAELISLKHMRMVSEDERKTPVVYYLPHHPVINESSTTTKVRGVFDASAKTSTGFSLNDLLLIGPVIQDDLLTIILRFRKYKVALLADIEKMYRQITIHPDDRGLQRVLWRFDKNQQITEYELTTVTYGLGPSSFLATRTLHQLADDEGKSFPIGAQSLKRDFYMDDFVCGESSIEKAIQLRKEIDDLLKLGGFRLRKWGSNEEAVLEGIPRENLAGQVDRKFDNEDTIKTLGIVWEPASDRFRFVIQPISIKRPITKRNIMSCVAKLYDPLGLISPIVIRAKVLLQKLWTLSLDWDEEVPEIIQREWSNYIEELPNLSKFRISRNAFGEGELQLHCFADASETAYGACVYVRSLGENGEVKVELLASKSRVAPLQRRSIPRLELCAAQMAASLYRKIVTALEVQFSSTWFWSDSMVVLHWLRAPSQTWKTFVSNRVADIQNLTHGSKWQHVPGATNPADLLSRGMSVKKFLECQIWKNGPCWLWESEDKWPIQKIETETSSEMEFERKSTILTVQAKSPTNFVITRFSSYNRMIRTIAYCIRFIHNARKGTKITSTTLSVEELEKTKLTLIKLVQTECYNMEIHQLRKGQMVSNTSRLKLFNPFLDSVGILRVGGRLNLSEETYAVRHQILLPGFHHFTRLLLEHYHLKLIHGGISLTLAEVRKEFWPINGKRAVRSIIRNCYRCTRANPRPIKQPIGQLPAARITASRAFSSTGIDYCGPVFVKSLHRKAAPTKAYIAIFVCFCTKAVHIELVGDLSTASFISALRRFIARRGKPEHLYSDNAKNFAGAKNELNTLYRMFSSCAERDHISSHLAMEGITWHLIPPRAPNFGGLWEAAVKVAKRHLIRQLGNTILLYEDLVTILTQIEGCMNSRPLIPLSEDPEDYTVLTPGHFLFGTSPEALPDPDVSSVPINRLNRYQLIQQRVQQFWYKWKTEYLMNLQRQTSTNSSKVNLKVGQMVILQDQQLPPIRWPLARIVELHPGHDGVTRVVTLRTPTGEFKRACTKLCLLPTMDDFHDGDEPTERGN